MSLSFAAGFGACLLGAVGFAAGFFGPIALNPEANQGPLLGIFITGPGGAALGAILGAALHAFGLSKERTMGLLGGAAALGAAVILFFCLPGPKYVGNVIEAEVTECVSPVALKDEAFAEWEKRIKDAPWGRPREGWKDGFLSMVAGDQGVVVTVKVRRSAGVYENRKPWNRGKLSAGKAWWVHERYFLRGEGCAGQAGRVGVFAPRGETSKAWPSDKLSAFLGLSVLHAATPEQAALLP